MDFVSVKQSTVVGPTSQREKQSKIGAQHSVDFPSHTSQTPQLHRMNGWEDWKTFNK